jgi:hypothetical protein
MPPWAGAHGLGKENAKRREVKATMALLRSRAATIDAYSMMRTLREISGNGKRRKVSYEGEHANSLLDIHDILVHKM